jgi:hypothetical protein
VTAVASRCYGQDRQGQRHQLQFGLPIDAVKSGSTEFKPFSNRDYSNWLVRELQSALQPFNRGNKSIRVIAQYNGYRLSARGVNEAEFQAIRQRVHALEGELFKQYLRQQQYMDIGENRVMPDYVNIAKRYQPALRDVAAALTPQLRGLSQREGINHVLHWLQSKPYDQLQSRYTSNGAGFQTPYGLLVENRGDCDTKAVMLIALLKNLYPSQQFAFVFTPGHAFVGVSLRQDSNDFALRISGQTYVLMDPTGPYLSELGEISKTVADDLLRGDYSYRLATF